MLLQTTISSSPPLQHHHQHPHSLLPLGFLKFRPHKIPFQHFSSPDSTTFRVYHGLNVTKFPDFQIHGKELAMGFYSLTSDENICTLCSRSHISSSSDDNFGLQQCSGLCILFLSSRCNSADFYPWFIFPSSDCILPPHIIFEIELSKNIIQTMNSSSSLQNIEDNVCMKRVIVWVSVLSFGKISLLTSAQVAHAGESIKPEAIYEEQVRSGDATATGLFELGAVMLRRKFYPAATRYLLQAIEKWDGDDQDLAQVYNALGVSYVLDEKLDRGIKQFEAAVKLQPGYVTAWNNLGDAYEKKKDLKSALMAFEEVLLFDPNNKVARPRRDALKDKVQMYRGVPIKSKDR
uniref:Uncharacterized protein n=1 Tax=Salix viminalis TaxID=40686 RepID=A0A6N2LV90_SALVM